MKKGQKRGRGGGTGRGRGRAGGGKARSNGGSKRRKGEVGPVAIAPEQESAKPAAVEEDADPFAEMGASGKDDDGGFGAGDDPDVLYRSDFFPSEDGLMPVGGAGVEEWLDAPMPDADMVCGAADEVTMFAVQDELMGMPQSAAEIGDL